MGSMEAAPISAHAVSRGDPEFFSNLKFPATFSRLNVPFAMPNRKRTTAATTEIHVQKNPAIRTGFRRMHLQEASTSFTTDWERANVRLSLRNSKMWTRPKKQI